MFGIGKLLRKCNAQKEKGVPVLDILKYKLCNVFSDRSMYMQLKTGSFREAFSKNTFYRFLIGWTDGNTFLPVNSSLLASSKASNLIGPAVNFDGRSLAAKRRKLAQMKGTDVMIELLKNAYKAALHPEDIRHQ